MFVGHYGVAFLGKDLARSVPLWVLFLAVQLVDVFWAVFVLIGVEEVRIVPGITATNPFDLHYMPYTHSLVASVGWAAAGYAGYRLLARGPRVARAAAVVGAAVLSHWFLDLLVHRPDLPIYDNAWKVGLGLWDYPALAFLLEAAILFGGIALYMRQTIAVSRIGRFAMPVFGVAMLALQAAVFFGPPPGSGREAAVTALLGYALLAGLVAWLERGRRFAIGEQVSDK